MPKITINLLQISNNLLSLSPLLLYNLAANIQNGSPHIMLTQVQNTSFIKIIDFLAALYIKEALRL